MTPAFAQASPFGGDTLLVLPIFLLGILSAIPAWRLCRKLGPAPAWALWGFVPLWGHISLLWLFAYGRKAGWIFVGIFLVVTIGSMLTHLIASQ